MNRMRVSATSTLVSMISVLVFMMMPAEFAGAKSPYSFEDIQCTGQDAIRTIVNGINNSGAIVGTYLYGTSPNGYGLWDGFLGNCGEQLHFDNTFTEASGINDSGVVVGVYGSGLIHHGFVYSGGTPTQIDYPTDPELPNTAVLGINNNGDLVGWYSIYGTGGLPTHGFSRINGQFATIDYPGSNNTSCRGINNSGQIVGTYYDSQDTAHGFLYSGGTFKSVEYPGAAGGTEANGINDKGKIVGTWYDADYYGHGFVYDLATGKFTRVDYPGAEDTYVKGINNSGQLVGEWDDADHDDGFIATPSGNSISGTVRKRDGTPVEQVTITLSGTSSNTTKTAFDGTYSFEDLQSGSYTITPSKDKFTFNPKVIKVTITDEDIVSQDFTLQTFTISGVVKSKKGEPADGVTMVLSGDSSDTTETASDGTYSFSDLVDGTYTVTPTPNTDWYYFKPEFKVVVIKGKDINKVNFTGKTPHDISGRILQGIDPVPGVTVTLTNSATAWTTQATTDSDGNYEFKSLLEGSYVVTPSLAGFAFKPASKKVKIKDSDIADVDFSALALHSISGVVTVDGAPLSGATITLTGKPKATTMTGADGSYLFTNLLSGTYAITPKMTGYTFTPPKITVTVTNTDVSGQNFTGKGI